MKEQTEDADIAITIFLNLHMVSFVCYFSVKMPSYSIVEYFADHSGYKCGYCKNSASAFSQGWVFKSTII